VLLTRYYTASIKMTTTRGRAQQLMNMNSSVTFKNINHMPHIKWNWNNKTALMKWWKYRIYHIYINYDFSLYVFMNIIHSKLQMDQPSSLLLLQNNFPSCSFLLPIFNKYWRIHKVCFNLRTFTAIVLLLLTSLQNLSSQLIKCNGLKTILKYTLYILGICLCNRQVLHQTECI
jgi:hypothetical protein